MVRIGTFRREELRALETAILCREQKQCVAVLVRLVDVPQLAVEFVPVLRAKALDELRDHVILVELPVRQVGHSGLELFELAVTHHARELVGVHREPFRARSTFRILWPVGHGWQDCDRALADASVRATCCRRAIGRGFQAAAADLDTHDAVLRQAAVRECLRVSRFLEAAQPSDRVEDLLAVKVVLDAKRIAQIIIVEVIKKGAVDCGI
mmetsp:Transcript_20787/g.66320  ORF Transcript_20787/g.66320 Transcript_20787/m.66320 type:complete len:210 (+) Transcript_20787:1027-1656(+)